MSLWVYSMPFSPTSAPNTWMTTPIFVAQPARWDFLHPISFWASSSCLALLPRTQPNSSKVHPIQLGKGAHDLKLNHSSLNSGSRKP